MWLGKPSEAFTSGEGGRERAFCKCIPLLAFRVPSVYHTDPLVFPRLFFTQANASEARGKGSVSSVREAALKISTTPQRCCVAWAGSPLLMCPNASHLI